MKLKSRKERKKTPQLALQTTKKQISVVFCVVTESSAVYVVTQQLEKQQNMDQWGRKMMRSARLEHQQIKRVKKKVVANRGYLVVSVAVRTETRQEMNQVIKLS